MVNQIKIESTVSNGDSTIYSTENPKSTFGNIATTLSPYNKGISNCKINSNYSITSGLTHYWGFNGNLNDSIGYAHLFGGMNYNLTLNRFNSSYSALNLTYGFLKMPDGVYFNSSFTAMSWINVKEFTNWARLFDIGIGQTQNVFLSYTMYTNQIPYGYTANDGGSTNLNPATQLFANKWQHLAFVLDNQIASIYIDGVQQVFKASFAIPKNVDRDTCFIGKSNWNDGLANAYFDEIKFFNRALTNQEIIFEMANDFCL